MIRSRKTLKSTTVHILSDTNLKKKLAAYSVGRNILRILNSIQDN